VETNATPAPDDGAAATSSRFRQWLRDQWRALYGNARLRGILQFLGAAFLVLAGVILAGASVQNFWYWVFLIAGLAFTGLNIALTTAASRFEQKSASTLETAQTTINNLHDDVARAKASETNAIGRADEVADEVAELRSVVKEQMETLLRALCEAFSFDATERITIYRPAAQGELKLIARYSQDLDLRKVDEANRTRAFELSHGLIGRVAKTGIRQTRADGPPPTDRALYRKWQRELGLTHKTAMAELRMKSRTYDVVAIDQDGNQGRAVVALESTEGESDEVRALGQAIDTATVVLPMITTLVALLASMPTDDLWKENDHGDGF
jgi:hypothetical protein